MATKTSRKIRSHFFVKIIALVIIASFLGLATYWAFFTPVSEEITADCEMREMMLSSPDGALEVYITAEMALTDAQKQTGLMHRKSLERGTGMLFSWDVPQQVYMWMKNTFIPLDIIFINGNEVVGVVHAKNTQDETPLTVKGHADKVLEVNYGFATAHGVTKGWYVGVGACAK